MISIIAPGLVLLIIGQLLAIASHSITHCRRGLMFIARLQFIGSIITFTLNTALHQNNNALLRCEARCNIISSRYYSVRAAGDYYLLFFAPLQVSSSPFCCNPIARRQAGVMSIARPLIANVIIGQQAVLRINHLSARCMVNGQA